MTPEARLDRLERIAMLLVRAGYRARRELRERDREHDKKIDHLIDLQIGNEELQRKTELRFAQNDERFARKFAQLANSQNQTHRSLAQLANSQAQTDRSLAELVSIIRNGRDGKAQTDS